MTWGPQVLQPQLMPRRQAPWLCLPNALPGSATQMVILVASQGMPSSSSFLPRMTLVSSASPNVWIFMRCVAQLTSSLPTIGPHARTRLWMHACPLHPRPPSRPPHLLQAQPMLHSPRHRLLWQPTALACRRCLRQPPLRSSLSLLWLQRRRRPLQLWQLVPPEARAVLATSSASLLQHGPGCVRRAAPTLGVAECASLLHLSCKRPPQVVPTAANPTPPTPPPSPTPLTSPRTR